MTVHATWWNTPAAPSTSIVLEAALATAPARPTTAQRIAARRDRIGGIVAAEVHATREAIAAEFGGYDPQLEGLLIEGLSIEEAVEALCAPVLGSLSYPHEDGALELIDEVAPDFASGLYADDTLAITSVAVGGPGYLDAVAA